MRRVANHAASRFPINRIEAFEKLNRITGIVSVSVARSERKFGISSGCNSQLWRKVSCSLSHAYMGEGNIQFDRLDLALHPSAARSRTYFAWPGWPGYRAEFQSTQQPARERSQRDAEATPRTVHGG